MDSNNQHLVAELNRFGTFSELRRSEFYRKNRANIKRLLDEPKVYLSGEAGPRLRDFLRVAEWNIERGSNLEAIKGVLQNHPTLSYADLLLVNELDCGMARSGNRDVACELGGALRMHAVFGVEYLELTKGTGHEREVEAENTAALHGNAILSRRPITNIRLVRLSRCEDNFQSAEKRLGSRVGIVADIETGGSAITAALTHLDVVGLPSCRAGQLRSFLEFVDAEAGAKGRVIFGGDLNTHTFKRGGRLRTVNNVIRIFGNNEDRLRRTLLHPEAREPAIGELKRRGYEVESFNDRRPTSWSVVSRLEDAARLPFPLSSWVMRRIGPEGLMLQFKLDWLAGRGVRALREGEATDRATSVTSLSPHTINISDYHGSPLSDHDPVVVDIALD
jgi:endonuclease/exonuclease/phosphatase family metal-dependent hydrolase